MKLDKFQQEVVNYRLSFGDNLLVEANAGSGKTTTVLQKIVSLIESGVSPNDIFVTTFSNRIASEIRKKLINKSINIAAVGTTHSLCYKLSNTDCKIITEWESIKIIRDILKEQIRFNFKYLKEYNNLASRVKEYMYFYNANLIGYEEPISKFFDDVSPLNDKTFKFVVSEYDKIKKSLKLVDYDDLVSPEFVSKINELKNKFVFIDEAQDFSKANNFAIRSIFGEESAYVYVYDVKQTLYSFRHAYPDMFIEPDKHFKSYNKLKLKYNYRSVENIVRVFNSYARTFGGEESIPIRGNSNSAVKILTLDNDTQVGTYIARWIVDNKISDYSKITVLVRKSSFIKSVIEPAFVKYGIPYKVRTPYYRKKFFEINSNRFLLSVIRYAISKDRRFIHEVSDLFIGIGKSRMGRFISGHINDTKYKIIEDFINRINEYEINDYKDFGFLFDFVVRHYVEYIKHDVFSQKEIRHSVKTFSNFIKMVSVEEKIQDPTQIVYEMVSRIDEYEEDKQNAVELTTVFQYKGLENEIVFITDMCDNQFEFNNSTYPVMYVALSRATDKMICVNYNKKHNYKFGLVPVKKYPKFEEAINNIVGRR